MTYKIQIPNVIHTWKLIGRYQVVTTARAHARDASTIHVTHCGDPGLRLTSKQARALAAQLIAAADEEQGK